MVIQSDTSTQTRRPGMDPKVKSRSGRSLTIVLHVVVLLFLFLTPTYLLVSGSMRDRGFVYEVWFQFACYTAIFYLCYLYLAPRFFFRGRKTVFFFLTVLLVLLMAGAFLVWRDHAKKGDWFEQVMRPRPGPPREMPAGRRPPPEANPPRPFNSWPVLNFLLTSGLVAGLSLGLRFSEKMVQNEKLRKETERERIRTELDSLKHQLNPHFLFNTLNSIYSLALIKSEKTPEAVMMLADMMHYVLQEGKHEMVPLEKEIEYLTHYVDLQKIRLSDTVEVRMTVEGDPAGYEVPPMILFALLENAFKYGTSSHEHTVIGITTAIRGDRLSYTVTNRVFAGREETGTFGIGIRNTRLRLDLIYPGRHKLELADDGHTFTAHMEIDLA